LWRTPARTIASCRRPTRRSRQRRARRRDRSVRQQQHARVRRRAIASSRHAPSGALEPLGAVGRVEGRVDGDHARLRAQPAHLAGREHAVGEDEVRAGRLVPQARAVAERDARLEHPGVADGIDRRARLLREAELEVVVEPARVRVEQRRGRVSSPIEPIASLPVG
jgi:hypothetical protein